MKKSTFALAILCTFMLTACGDNADTSKTADYVQNSAEFADEVTVQDNDYSEEYQENSDSESVSDSDSEDGVTKLSEKTNNTSDEIIRKEMLVYSCNMTVDVLEFDNYIDQLKDNIDKYSAFLENENYNDGGTNGRWYNSDREKWQSYSATIRVPSDKYEEFCDNIAEQGDLRSKTSSVENMSREYYDLSSDLEIYEEKEKRYMERLSTIKDEEYALQVENELTNIQLEISRIKTRMNDIKTDVAYSYVNLTVNEVREYVEEPEEPMKTDTFGQRFKATVTKASSGFLTFMEKLLFLIIYILPYALTIGLVTFVIVKIGLFVEKLRKKRTQTTLPESPENLENPDIND